MKPAKSAPMKQHDQRLPRLDTEVQLDLGAGLDPEVHHSACHLLGHVLDVSRCDQPGGREQVAVLVDLHGKRGRVSNPDDEDLIVGIEVALIGFEVDRRAVAGELDDGNHRRQGERQSVDEIGHSSFPSAVATTAGAARSTVAVHAPAADVARR